MNVCMWKLAVAVEGKLLEMSASFVKVRKYRFKALLRMNLHSIFILNSGDPYSKYSWMKLRHTRKFNIIIGFGCY